MFTNTNKKEIIKDVVIILLFAILLIQNLSFENASNKNHSTTGRNIGPGLAEIATKQVSSIKNTPTHLKKEKGHRIDSTGHVVAHVSGKITHSKSSKRKTPEKYGVKEVELFWHDDETHLDMPIGVAIFNPKKEEKGQTPWITKAYNIDFSYDILETIDRNGVRHHEVSLFAKPHNRKSFNGEFPLKIDVKNSYFRVVEEKKYVWDFWNPTLSGGAGYVFGGSSNTNDSFALIGKFNFINYGYKKSLPVWQFMSPIITIRKSKIDFGIEPISYNIGELLPLVKDIHIGLAINTSKQGSINITSIF